MEGKVGKVVPGGIVKIETKTRRCLECNSILSKKYIEDVLYWICPNGCGRWAPNIKTLREQHQHTQKYLGRSRLDPLPPTGGTKQKKHSSNRSGKKHKKKLKKPRPYYYYD